MIRASANVNKRSHFKKSNGKGKWSVVFNNAEVRVTVFLYPSTLVSTRNDDEHCIMVILFDNGKR